jgi:hypothetical protein
VSDDPLVSLRAARRDYFERNGFGPRGGYDERWVKLRLGPLVAAFPNTAARVRAVRYHDLHHVVTGYATDLLGEAEIAAWELASGCRGFVAAWLLNLSALAIGLAIDPGAVFRAFLRGRRSQNLYGASLDDALLESRVGAVRARLGLDQGELRAGASDRLAFAACAALAVATLGAQLALLAAPLVGLAILCC